MTKMLDHLTIDGRDAIVIGRGAVPQGDRSGWVARYNREAFEQRPRTSSRGYGFHVQFQDDGELRTITPPEATRAATAS